MQTTIPVPMEDRATHVPNAELNRGSGVSQQKNQKPRCSKTNTLCKMLQVLRVFVRDADYRRILSELDRPFPCVETKMKFLLSRVNEIDPSLAARCLSKLKSKCNAAAMCRKRPRGETAPVVSTVNPSSSPPSSAKRAMLVSAAGPVVEPDTTCDNSPFRRLVHALRVSDAAAITELLNDVLASSEQSDTHPTNGESIANQTDTQGNTLLQIAAEQGEVSATKQLLDAGIFNANSVGARADRRTPLMLAARMGHEQVCKVFLDSGARVEMNALDAYGCTALHLAIRYKHNTLIPPLLDHGSTLELSVCEDSNNNSRLTPLMISAIGNNVTAVDCLLERGTSLSTRTGAGYTAFLLAAKAGAVEAMSRLFDKSTCVDQVCAQGFSALHLAARNGHSAAVLKLIQMGLKVDTHTQVVEGSNSSSSSEMASRRTPLMMACELGRTETALVLVRMGAQLNAADSKGMTPGMLAEENGHIRTLQALKLHAASPVDHAAWI